MRYQELITLIDALKREPIKNADLITFYERKKRTIISDAISTAIHSVINQNQII